MTTISAWAVAATKDDDEASVNNILGILNLLIPIYPSEETVIDDLRETSTVDQRTFIKITVETVDDMDPTGEKLAAVVAARGAADDNLTVQGDDAFDAALGDFLDGDDDDTRATAPGYDEGDGDADDCDDDDDDDLK